jgi:hypothetical protein
MTAKTNISQENIIPTSNTRQPQQFVNQAEREERTAQKFSSEDVSNPMFASESTSIGKPLSSVAPTAEYLKSKGIPTEGVVNQPQIREALINAAAKKQSETKQLDPRQRAQRLAFNAKNARMSKKAEADRQAAAERQEAERQVAERQEAERQVAERLAAERLAADRQAAAERQAEFKRQEATKKAISNINVQENTALQKQGLEAEIKRQGGLDPESQAKLESEQAFRKAQMEQFNQQFALANKPEQDQQQTAVTSNTNTKPTSWFTKVTSPFNKKGGSNKNRTLKKREQNIKIRLV